MNGFLTRPAPGSRAGAVPAAVRFTQRVKGRGFTGRNPPGLYSAPSRLPQNAGARTSFPREYRPFSISAQNRRGLFRREAGPPLQKQDSAGRRLCVRRSFWVRRCLWKGARMLFRGLCRIRPKLPVWGGASLSPVRAKTGRFYALPSQPRTFLILWATMARIASLAGLR